MAEKRSHDALDDQQSVELARANVLLDREIAEHRLAEEALKLSEERLRYATVAAGIGTWHWDLRTSELVWDEKCKQLFGYPTDHRVSYNAFLAAICDEDRQRVDDAVHESLRERSEYLVEMRVVLPDGRLTWVMSKGRGFYDEFGRPILMHGIAMDITERKLQEQALEQAHAESGRRASEFRSFIASMADGVMVFDADGNVVFANESGKEILGLKRGEKITRWLLDYKRYYLDGSPVPMEECPTVRALHGETVRDMRYRVVAPGGRDAVLGTSASPLFDGEGKVVGATLVFRDERSRADLERRQQELYERERHIAMMLQNALVPPVTSIDIEGCRAALRYEPALTEAQIGGDFYDVFQLGDGKVGFVIGDIAGKGLAAAVYVAAAKHAIRSYAYLFASPAEVLQHANDALCKTQLADGDQMSATMLTAFFAIVDAESGVITYANAGHEAPMIRHRDGSIEELLGTDIVLGIVCGVTYREIHHDLEFGDTVVMVTDGITEARPFGSLLFGKDGVLRYLSEHPKVSFRDIPSGLLEAARAHGGGRLQDDAAIVAFLCDVEKPLK